MALRRREAVWHYNRNPRTSRHRCKMPKGVEMTALMIVIMLGLVGGFAAGLQGPLASLMAKDVGTWGSVSERAYFNVIQQAMSLKG